MCGSTAIDGYAFCLGLQSLRLFYDALPDLRNPICSVTYLIRGSIFWPKYATSPSGGVSLGIHPLGELIDMYHTHKATERRDKVFALLGMSSDDPSAARLLPNYEISCTGGDNSSSPRGPCRTGTPPPRTSDVFLISEDERSGSRSELRPNARLGSNLWRLGQPRADYGNSHARERLHLSLHA
jgi:hypothetical protein